MADEDDNNATGKRTTRRETKQNGISVGVKSYSGSKAKPLAGANSSRQAQFAADVSRRIGARSTGRQATDSTGCCQVDLVGPAQATDSDQV